MTHGGLFYGIGGFGLAAEWAGIENIWANEIDPYCCKVLAKNFSNLKVYEQDIRTIGKHNLAPVDIITGGFPCQPFSHAGKRKGKEDDRYLWPEMLRIISELMPSFVIGENVAGLKSMENGRTLEGILIDLEDIGYQVETFLVPACGVGAWHQRGRIWIVAHADTGFSHRKEGEIQTGGNTSNDGSKDVSNTISQRLERGNGLQRAIRSNPGSKEDATNTKGKHKRISRLCKEQQERETGGQDIRVREHSGCSVEPNVGRVANGIPSTLDRLKGLGNAIVPLVAYEFFEAILLFDDNIH